jgi:Mg2+/Co2+ transporter CorB
MEEIALGHMFGALGVLLVLSGFFSIAETSMMAINRYRLKHMVAQGHGGAARVEELLKRTDKLLGAILIGNNLVNAAAATLASLIAVELFGQGKLAYAVSTIAISFLLIVFAEITPKVVGATYPERIAPTVSYVLKPVQWLLQPGVWFVNLFVRPLLLAIGIRPEDNARMDKLSPEEIRTLVLESSSFMPKKHFSILMNLFDVGAVTVQDIMLPRSKIESIKLDDDMETIVRHLVTAYHQRLPVFRSALGEVVGVLHLKRRCSTSRRTRSASRWWWTSTAS